MSAEEAVANENKTVECIVHVRFSNDGTVMEIGECPPPLTPDHWFKVLSHNTLNRYQALAGGRGVFKIPRTEIEQLKATATQESAS